MNMLYKIGLGILGTIIGVVGIYGATGQSITSLTQTVNNEDIITADYYNKLNGPKSEGKSCKFTDNKLVCLDDMSISSSSSSTSGGGGAIDGTCGSDAGVRNYMAFSSPPTNLCLSGLPSTVNKSDLYTYIWLCNGTNGGITSVCTATQGEDPFGDSDRNLKKDIASIQGAYSLIDKLEGVHFNWKDTGRKDIGFIAQDVQSILPELVRYDETRGVYQVSYQGIIPVLVEAMKEQERRHQQDMDSLNNQIEEIKKQMK